jgi:heat shock protein HslJ
MDHAEGAILEDTRWRLVEYLGPAGVLVAVPAEVTATATFTDGRIAGSAGCNRYFAACTIADDAIAIDGAIGSTMMACPEPVASIERAYLATLATIASWEITGDRLELRTADGGAGLRFIAESPTSLTGSPWEATAVNNGRGGVASVVGGSTLTARFADGQVAGSAGCNRFHGPYALDGTALLIGPLASTRRACPEPAGVMEQEAAYLTALAKVATWSIEGDRLQLRDAGGALQVDYRAASSR